MEIDTASMSGSLVLRLVGNFETYDVEAFESLIEDAIDAGHRKVLVDATKMGTVVSSSLGSLIRAQGILRQRGGELAVTGLSPFASQVFATLGLDRKIACFAESEAALEHLSGSGGEQGDEGAAT